MKIKQSDAIVLAAALGAAYLILKKGGVIAKSPFTGATSFFKWNPVNPDQGASYDPANPAAYIPTSSLINGAINDYYSGDTSSYATPTIAAIDSSVLHDLYGTTVKTGPYASTGAYW